MKQGKIKKIYISGKISGLDTHDVCVKFHYSRHEIWKCESYLVYENVVNPLEIAPLFGIRKWFFFMFSDIIQLLKCDAICMQQDWLDSRGARIELAISLLTRKKVYFQKWY